MDKKIYLELLVVVDKKMKDYYGENLENHILTLMFLVRLIPVIFNVYQINEMLIIFQTTQMYQHPSIVNPLRVYLTDIIYISELDSEVTKFSN